MNSSPTNLSHYRSEVQQQTPLRQICGSEKLFRDRYEILKVIGRGGFGVTFLVRDVSLPGQPLCVIKQLCPKVNDAAALKKARQRFEQEAKVLGRLGNHAQIPMLLDYFEVDGDFFLVQEYVRGYTLAKQVRRSGSLTEADVKQFLGEFLPLLQYIHDSHVIHRDIKPPNLIRCRDDGRLVLIDFGAVKEHIVQVSDHSLKQSTTQFIGTVGFAPPEQLAMRPVYSSDLYAVGITCLYLLSGKSPLDFDYEFMTGEIRWWDHIDISEHLKAVLSRMLRISPRERYQSPQEVLRALELESHLDSLGSCMTVRSRPPRKPNLTTINTNSYVPPLIRTAAAIRDWQAKLQARQARGTTLQPKVSYSSSSCFK